MCGVAALLCLRGIAAGCSGAFRPISDFGEMENRLVAKTDKVFRGNVHLLRGFDCGKYNYFSLRFR